MTRQAERQITHLDEALNEASYRCPAGGSAVIYYTTDKAVATVPSGELYLVFRGDDPTQFHLREDQGWRVAYTLTAPK